MMKQLRKLFIGIMILCWSVLAPAATADAYDVIDYMDARDGWQTKSYDVKVVADESAVFHYTETIEVNFYKPMHGIYRDIPLAEDDSYALTNIEVASDVDYTVDEEDGRMLITLGSEDETVTGYQTYVLSYDIAFYEDKDDTHDSFAVNLFPENWDNYAEEASLTLVMPKEIDWSEATFSDGYGEESELREAPVFQYSTSGSTFTATGKMVPYHFGFTVRDDALPEGYWTNPLSHTAQLGIRYYIVIGTMAGGVLLSIIVFLLMHRSVPMKKTPTYFPPDGLHSAAVGYAMKGTADNEEVMSLMFYLAQKGYLTIHETKKDYYVLRRNVDELSASDEPESVRMMFDAFFPNGEDSYDLELMHSWIYDSVEEIKEQVAAEFEDSYGAVYTASSIKARKILEAITFVMMVIITFCAELDFNNLGYTLLLSAVFGVGSGFIAAPELHYLCEVFDHRYSGTHGHLQYVAAGLVGITLACYMFFHDMWLLYLYPVMLLCYAIILCLAFAMPVRSETSATLMGRILGFRDFIRDTDGERLKSLNGEHPNYYYEMLPYAIVFGLTKRWGRKFMEKALPHPPWYTAEETVARMNALSMTQMSDQCIKKAVLPIKVLGGRFGSGDSSRSSGGAGGGGGGAW